jgi:hypothetical protein
VEKSPRVNSECQNKRNVSVHKTSWCIWIGEVLGTFTVQVFHSLYCAPGTWCFYENSRGPRFASAPKKYRRTISTSARDNELHELHTLYLLLMRLFDCDDCRQFLS